MVQNPNLCPFCNMKLELFCLILVVSAVAAQWDPHCHDKSRAIVHLFEWRWVDVAAECERFLGPKGYCGLQVSVPNEHVVFMQGDIKRPWWERYQPVSYKTYTRSGDEGAFNDMVKRCNNAGVRVYVDLVMNHMCGADSKGVGVGGSSYDGTTKSFPAVPYTVADFHSATSSPPCTSSSGNIENYMDPVQVRNCQLVGLRDLNQAGQNVRDRLVEWVNRFIKVGVAGFRIDAAKHMYPADLQVIYNRFDDLSATWFPPGTRPFVYQEVIDYGGEPIKSAEYFPLGRVTEFNYGKYVTQSFRGYQQLKSLKTFGEGFGYLMPDEDALVFIDNHDNQRGHGGGSDVATFWEPRLYKMCVSYMLAWPYGTAQVMSSYWWPRKFIGGQDQNDWYGPPADSNYNILPVTINANGTCGNNWICEHRWPEIMHMVEFRNVAGTDTVQNWWDDGDNQIAFSRGNKAFYVVNNSPNKNLDSKLTTGLPAGKYCDIISGYITEDKKACTGKSIEIDSQGKASITILTSADPPVIAIHVDAKISS